MTSGWLGSPGMDAPVERKLAGAFGVSLALHGALALAALAAMGAAALQTPAPVSEPIRLVLLAQPAPAGGGGGSPLPAPAPAAAPPVPAPAPVQPEPLPIEAPRPLPALTAFVQTDLTSTIGASGASVSLASFGGTGVGSGVGPGLGSGIGPGTGGGFGGGAYRPGAGVVNPVLLRDATPRYTSDAMRARIQGSVELEAVVRADGTVGDVRIVQSLDARYGLDEEAIRAAKQWRFRPGTRGGQPVDVIVTLVLDFRLQ